MRWKDTKKPTPTWEWKLKNSNVDVSDLHPNIITYLGTLEPEYQDMILATSGRDSNLHTEKSRHYSGNAVDLRIWDKDNPKSDKLYQRMEKDPLRLMYGLTIIDPIHGTAPHIDLSYGAGTQNKKDVWIDPFSEEAEVIKRKIGQGYTPSTERAHIKFKDDIDSVDELSSERQALNDFFSEMPQGERDFIVSSTLAMAHPEVDYGIKEDDDEEYNEIIQRQNELKFLEELASVDFVDVVDNPMVQDSPMGMMQMGGKVPVSNNGLWEYPNQPVVVPSNNITMEGVNYPVMAYPDNDKPVLMQPNMDYTFENSSKVLEIPVMQNGGGKDYNIDEGYYNRLKKWYNGLSNEQKLGIIQGQFPYTNQAYRDYHKGRRIYDKGVEVEIKPDEEVDMELVRAKQMINKAMQEKDPGLKTMTGLIKRGFTAEESAAAAGNIDVESAGFNSNIFGDLHMDTPSYGLMQWREERLNTLRKFYGDNPTFEDQLDYMALELKHGITKDSYDTKKFNQAVEESSNLGELTAKFAKYVERPSDDAYNESIDKRKAKAEEHFNNLLKYAPEYLSTDGRIPIKDVEIPDITINPLKDFWDNKKLEDMNRFPYPMLDNN